MSFRVITNLKYLKWTTIFRKHLIAYRWEIKLEFRIGIFKIKTKVNFETNKRSTQ
jgi:hypothetical protein